MIKRALSTDKKEGRLSDDKRSFMQSVLVALSSSPDDRTNKRPSTRSYTKSLGIPCSTARRLVRSAKSVRADLKNLVAGISWSTLKQKKG